MSDSILLLLPVSVAICSILQNAIATSDSQFLNVGGLGGEWREQVGSINEESQVSGCYKKKV